MLAHRGPGELVGEMALLDGGIRSACVRATETSTLIIITRDQLSRRLAETDPILRMCLSVVLDRYRGDGVPSRGQGGAPPPPPDDPARQDTRAFVTDAIDTLLLEREIKAGLERGEFTLYLQPILRLGSRRLAGFEALMRWNHPVRGLLPRPPSSPSLNPRASSRGLTASGLAELAQIFPLIARAARAHPEACEGDPFVAINVSGHDVADRPSRRRSATSSPRRRSIPRG